MEYVYGFISTIISGILLAILKGKINENKKLKNEKETLEKQQQTAIENGLVCLLRIELIDYHDKYIKEGSMPIYAHENFTLMYNAYKGLGGNGMIEHMREEIEKLPFKS